MYQYLGTAFFFSPVLLFLIYLSLHFKIFYHFITGTKMKVLLLLLFWLWLTPQAWGGGSKKDPPYFSNYNMDFIKNTQTLWGRMVTTCANGKPAFFVWDPLTQYKFHLSCSCGKPLRVHKWHQRIACLLEENCILLMRGYACRHKIKGEEVGCGKIYHSWDITSQLTPKLQRAFPFILFQKSALHKQVLRLVLTGLSKGVSMCATAEQMASLYEGRYNEVVHHAERYFPFSDWGAPPSEFLLIAMIAKEAARGKGFSDACLKSLGAHKLSADHTFKIAKKCTVKVDHHFEKLFDSAYFVLNELGMVLAWIDKDLETVAGKIWDWLEDVENQCDEGPSFDEDANAEEVADWWEKWTGVRSHIAREFRVNSLFDEPATNAHGRPKWYLPQSSEQLPLLTDLAHNGLRQMPIEGDGNCAFRALAHFLPLYATGREVEGDPLLLNFYGARYNVAVRDNDPSRHMYQDKGYNIVQH